MFRSPLIHLNKLLRSSLNVSRPSVPSYNQFNFSTIFRPFGTFKINHLAELQKSVTDSVAQLGAENPKLTKLYYELGKEYKKSNRFTEALSYFSKSYDLTKKILGQHALLLSKISFQIAECRIQLEDLPDAIEKYKEAIEIEKVHGRESGDVCMIMYYDLGVTYILQQDFNSAYQVMQHALTFIDSRKPDWISARFYSKLSFLNRRFKNLDEASKLARKGYEIVKSSEFDKTIIKSEVKAELGIVSFLQKKYEESQNLLREAIQERSSVYPTTDMETAHLTLFLGNVLQASEKYEEAVNVFNDALENYKKMILPDESMLQEIYYHLGRSQFFTDQTQEALQNTSKSLEILSKHHISETEQAALCYDSLIDIYSKLGDHDKYIETCQKALKIRQKLYGDNDPRTGKSYITAGTSDLCCDEVTCIGYLEKGIQILKPYTDNLAYFESLTTGLSTLSMVTKHENPALAEELILECIEIKQRVLGRDAHPSIADSLYGLATIYQSEGELEKGLSTIDKAYQMALITLGEKHFFTLEVIDLKGMILRDMEHFEEALKLQEESLRIKEENFTGDSTLLAPAYQLVGSTYYAMGDFHNALRFYKEGTDMHEGTAQSIDMELVQSWAKLSEIYHRLENISMEKEYLQRVLDFFREVEGEEGNNTKVVKDRMSRLG